MALPNGVERFEFAGRTYLTSVEDRAFIERTTAEAFIDRTTAEDVDANFTMCEAPLPPAPPPFPLSVLHLTIF
jgi:hypothetical protein